MPEPLARLRRELDIMPSPVPEQPGLLMRDPFGYTEAVIIVPPLPARTLGLFDGEHTEADLKAAFVRFSATFFNPPTRRGTWPLRSMSTAFWNHRLSTS